MCRERKPLVWLRGEVKTPPFSAEARREAGFLLARLQQDESVGMPHSRPMPAVGPRCHELRVNDRGAQWRIFYRTYPDMVLILDVLAKTTRATPRHVIEECARRWAAFDRDVRRGGGA